MKLKDCYESLIDRLKYLQRYELGREGWPRSYDTRCGGPDPNGEYVRLDEVIDLILELKDDPDF
jgi:hypothetical protein